jgi:hypothetical protein
LAAVEGRAVVCVDVAALDDDVDAVLAAFAWFTFARFEVERV